ncbi:outer membrane lipoprotein chaperone LolA [Volucribacter amazonae]|uniref:Outer-membrane lipoprotein carrier protein n=1 Tax=Volucribacter amazonae TaxID=256731 RepID=A0A9X4SR46_9PAST|nr:outer membrane lipoprotein chaperone LolA [Volucribacter amazonae]MDG6896156.1 outer-membrane lipoprotein carrier protein LolA [Volucribacter amazonae]
MKKIMVKMTALFILFINGVAWADASGELQKRLNLVQNLTADYQQTVSSPEGKNVQQGSGKLQLKRPNLFRMESTSPQQTEMISDGKTLWFYDPFVEQVTANWVTDVVNNTPFVLLTSNDKNHWAAYAVEQQVDTFVLTPKAINSPLKQFSIRIDSNGVLRNFSTIEQDGQSNLYTLRNISNQPLADKLFQFSPPKGVEFDDQRKK